MTTLDIDSEFNLELTITQLRVDYAAGLVNRVTVERAEGKQRTPAQNNALHLVCRMLAEGLNDAGFDMKATLRHDAEIPWEGDRVKKFLWRPVQAAMFGEESTTKLSTKQVSECYETLIRHLGSKLGYVAPPFPSREESQ